MIRYQIAIVILSIFLFCYKGKPSIPTRADWNHFSKDNWNEIDMVHKYIMKEMPNNVFTIEEILRQGTEWKNLDEPPFVIPPKHLWKNILPTIYFINRFIIPKIGEVEIVSSYRTRVYNQLAGGAKNSRHLTFNAFDMIPKKKISREQLHTILIQIWEKEGRQYKVGLGLYSGLRFQIDTSGFRKW